MAAVLALELVLVAWGGWRRRSEVAALLRGRSPVRIGLFALVFVGTAAALSASVSVYLRELALAAAIQAVSLGAVALGAAALPPGTARRTVDRLLAVDSRRPRLDRFAWIAAGWTVAVALLLAAVAYERHPHVPDEVAYLLNARYFADGMLTMDAPPVPAGFDVDLMDVRNGRWFSPMPPGWPAVLAIGSLLGVPWAVNPLAAGVVVLLAYLLAWRLYDRPTARITAALLAASPWLLFLGMSYMGHPVTIAMALGAAIAVARSREAAANAGGGSVEPGDPTPAASDAGATDPDRPGAAAGWALLAGALVGAVSIVRPMDGLAVGLVLGLWLAVDLARRRLRVLPALALGAGAAALGSLQLLYNRALTGEATTFPLMVYFDEIHGPGANALGFGPDRGFGWRGLDPYPGHDLLDAAINAALNGYALNVELFGWVTGSLFLVVGTLLFARLDRRDLGLAAAIAVVVGVYSLYWFSGGPDFGPRYWALILFPCVALAARGVRRLWSAFDARAVVGVAVLAASALLVFVPWRAIDKYHGYRGMVPDVRELAAERDFGGALVLVRGERHPDYGSAAAYLPADPRADAPIYAWDRNPEVRARLLEAYSGRPVWIVDGPTATGDGFRVATGPLPADEVQATGPPSADEIPASPPPPVETPANRGAP